jgi:hypothetical protein
MPKASAEARERCIAAMIEAASLYSNPYAPILWPAPDDPAWLASQEQEWREWLEPMSDSALEHERLWLGSRLGEEIGTSLFGHEQKFSRDGGKARAQQRRQIMLKKIEEGGRLFAEHPKLSPKRAYNLLGLHDGIIKITSFERRWWPEIRKIRQTLAG